MMTRIYIDGYGMLSGSEFHRYDWLLSTDKWYEHPLFKMNKDRYEYCKEHSRYILDMERHMQLHMDIIRWEQQQFMRKHGKESTTHLCMLRGRRYITPKEQDNINAKNFIEMIV